MIRKENKKLTIVTPTEKNTYGKIILNLGEDAENFSLLESKEIVNINEHNCNLKNNEQRKYFFSKLDFNNNSVMDIYVFQEGNFSQSMNILYISDLGAEYKMFDIPQIKDYLIINDYALKIKVTNINTNENKKYEITTDGEIIYIIPEIDHEPTASNRYKISIFLSKLDDNNLTNIKSPAVQDFKKMEYLLQGYEVNGRSKPETLSDDNLINFSYKCDNINKVYIEYPYSNKPLMSYLLLKSINDNKKIKKNTIYSLVKTLYDIENCSAFIDHHMIMICPEYLETKNVEKFKKLCLLYKIHYSDILITSHEDKFGVYI